MKVEFVRFARAMPSPSEDPSVTVELSSVPMIGDDVEVDDESWGSVRSVIWHVDSEAGESYVQVNVR